MPDAKQKQKGGAITTVIVVFLLTLVGAGAGFSAGTFLKQDSGTQISQAAPSTEETNKSETHDPHTRAPENTSDTNTGTSNSPEADEVGDSIHVPVKPVPFPPVLTMLTEPKGTWVRLEGSVLISVESEQPPELLAEKSGEQILAYLRTVRLDQLQGPSGLAALRDDLNETVSVLSNGDVRGILIHGLVVE